MVAKKSRPTPKAGSSFRKLYHGREYTLHVVREAGKIQYKLGNKLFGSPSGAAKTLTKSEINGWVFWGID